MDPLGRSPIATHDSPDCDGRSSPSLLPPIPRGINAAVGISPADARNAFSKIEDEDIGVPDVEISKREASIWHHWTEAQTVALEACCGDRKNVPPHSWLEYRVNDERDALRWAREKAKYLGGLIPLTPAEPARLAKG